MTKESAPITEGQILAGKYLVGRVLGQGGMGVVVAATHLQLEQKVALKLLLPSALEWPEIVTRFTREAQAAAKIQSEHVARVLDVGSLESGAPYMVMEHLEGSDLEQTLARRGALPVAEAVDCLLQCCEAVAEAHSLGIVHRDLKPANLFLAKRPGGKPIVKVLDFGISKAPEAAGKPGLTQTSSMFGSPPYMSPEQVKSTRSADARSDIWSLGAVLYELLTLHRPFGGDSVPAIYVAILHKDPEPPRVHRAEIPPALNAAVMRCLQKAPELRYQDVAALAFALGPFGLASSAQSVERIAHVLGVASPVVPDAAGIGGVVTLPSPSTTPNVGPIAPPAPVKVAPTPRPTSSRGIGPRVTLAVVAVLAVGASATAAYWLGGRRTPGPSDPRPLPHEATSSPSLSAPAPAAAAKAPAPEEAAATPERKPEPARPSLVRHAAPTSKPRPRGDVAGPTLATSAAVPTDDAKKSPPPSPPTVPLSTLCANLLERESLGETLTPKEKATYLRQCSK